MLLYLCLSDPLLRHLLYHAHESQLFLLRSIYLPECALSQLVQQLEVANSELPLRTYRPILQENWIFAYLLPYI